MEHNPYQAPGADVRTPAGSGAADGATYEPELFSLTGRIGRLRYLAYMLATGCIAFAVSMAMLVVAGIGGAVTKAQGGESLVMWLPSLTSLLLLVMYAVLAVRRFNDAGRTGWLALLLFVPLLNLAVALYLIFAPGMRGPNRFGLPPAPDSLPVKLAGWAMPLLMLAVVVFSLIVPMYMMGKATGAPGW